MDVDDNNATVDATVVVVEAAARDELIRDIADEAGVSPRDAGVPPVGGGGGGGGGGLPDATTANRGGGDTNSGTRNNKGIAGGTRSGGTTSPGTSVTLEDLLRGDPFELFVELMARVSAAAPGVFAGDKGTLHAEAVARVVTLAAVVQSAVVVGFRVIADEDCGGGEGGGEEEGGTCTGYTTGKHTGGGKGGGEEDGAMDTTDPDVEVEKEKKAAEREVDEEEDAEVKRAYAAVLRALHPDAPPGGGGGGGPRGTVAEAVARGAASTLWRVEALLELFDGAVAPPPSPHSAPSSPPLDDSPALACATRLFRRLGLGGRDGSDIAGVVSLLRLGVDVVPDPSVDADTDVTRGATATAYFKPGAAEASLHSWCGHLTAASTHGRRHLSSSSSSSPPRRPRLIPLPRRCEDLFLRMIDHPCKRCGGVPRDPALCLLCGELLCCAGFCCRRGRHGECAQHASACGAGVGVFLLVKSTKILLIRGKRICLYPSVYLDAHGEEDEFLKRGRPLFLSESRYAALSEMWLHAALDYDTLVLHSSRVGSDFY